MRTQSERDKEMIASVTRMITFVQPSIIRLLLCSTLSALLGTYQLAMQPGVLSGLVFSLSVAMALIATVDSARFGHECDQRNGGVEALTAIVIGAVVVFVLHRAFDYLDLGPTHRTLGWSIFVWWGYFVGVLASQISKNEKT